MVRETERASRMNTGRPSNSSSRLICIETADGVRNTALAAVVKLPALAIATKVRKRCEIEQRQRVI